MSSLNPVHDWLAKNGWLRSVARYGWYKGEHFIPEEQVMSFNIGDLIRSASDQLKMETDAKAAAAAWPPKPTWTPYEKMKMRLGLQGSEKFGIEHVHIVEGTNLVHVFLVHNENALIISDDKHLFPSDTTVAKFRLFMEACT